MRTLTIKYKDRNSIASLIKFDGAIASDREAIITYCIDAVHAFTVEYSFPDNQQGLLQAISFEGVYKLYNGSVEISITNEARSIQEMYEYGESISFCVVSRLFKILSDKI